MIVALAFLFVTTLLSGVFYFVFEKFGNNILKYISIFGGAFLMAICFVDMLPHIFSNTNYKMLCSAFILIGFLVQLLLELVSHGAEHGHLHNHTNNIMPVMVLIGVSLHAFFEGFALMSNGVVNTGLLIGIILHNVPVAVVIISSFIQSGKGKGESFVMLAIFAIMGVIGAIFNYEFAVSDYEPFVLSFVVGILLHVSVSTLFDSEKSHRYNLVRFLIVIAAFGIVFLLP
ncbi:MAG: ZIP family metal transporter [Bacteroidales bacterium]|jgi:zinc transporter ZupT|nr:ZIP family metal transporter [Bacteroidales bacterium]